MATVIDALVVTLGLNASGFKKGQEEAASASKRFTAEQEQNAKVVAAQAKAMADGFRKVRNELFGLFAASVGAHGFKDFIAGQVQGQAQLGYLSKNLNMQARELDAWGKSVRAVGGNAESFQQSLQSIASGIEQFKLTGDSDVVAMFRALNVNIGDGKKLRPYKDMLLDLSDALQRFDEQDQIRIAQSLGLDQGSLNLLRQGRQSVEKLFDQMYKTSSVSEESAKKAQEAQAAWAGFTAEASATAQTIFNALTPAIIDATNGLRDLGQWVNDHDQQIGEFFKGAADDVERLAKAIGGLSSGEGSGIAKLAAIAAAFIAIKGVAGGGIGGALRFGALGAAGYGGWRAGEQINEKIEGTPTGDVVGSLVAHTMALFGSKEAKTSIGINDLSDKQQMASYVKQYFMEQGWTAEQAAGITANLSAESNFDPHAYGDMGRAYGIAQWHPDRQQEFQKAFGKSIHQSTLEEQLAFVQHELTRGNERTAGNALRQAKTADEAGRIVSERYERPAEKEFEAQRRGELASMVAGMPAQGLPLATGQRPGGNTVTNTNEVSIGQITIQSNAQDSYGLVKDMQQAINENNLINTTVTGMR